MRYLSTGTILIVLLLNCLGCKTVSPTQSGKRPTNEIVLAAAPVSVVIDSSQAYYRGLINGNAVSYIYKSRDGHRIWVNDTGQTSLADSMILFIRRADDYGLTPSHYHVSQIADALENSDSVSHLTLLDMWLTDSFLAIAADLKSSRTSRKSMANDSTNADLLMRVVEGGDVRSILEMKEPSHSGYIALKEELRTTLDFLSDHVQTDSGSLNRKIKSIKINLDRWRNEGVPFADRYVYINVPSFMLHVVDNDSVVFSSRVIVGATRSPTPEITSMIECFTIYPYWHVPRKIAVEEYLPIIQKDTTFLRRNNFDVLDRKGKVLNPDSINWSTLTKNYFPLVLRQREGEENSLGIIKFMFDNPYAVYLHDTNSRKLFKSTRRAFSHGCIRMERAIDLAHFLVTGSLVKKSGIVGKLVAEKKRHTVNLTIPVPIYIRYYTAEVVNGEFYQYDDIYRLDTLIHESLAIDEVGSQK